MLQRDKIAGVLAVSALASCLSMGASQAIHGMATATDARIFKRLREQQRQIELQQQE